MPITKRALNAEPQYISADVLKIMQSPAWKYEPNGARQASLCISSKYAHTLSIPKNEALKYPAEFTRAANVIAQRELGDQALYRICLENPHPDRATLFVALDDSVMNVVEKLYESKNIGIKSCTSVLIYVANKFRSIIQNNDLLVVIEDGHISSLSIGDSVSPYFPAQATGSPIYALENIVARWKLERAKSCSNTVHVFSLCPDALENVGQITIKKLNVNFLELPTLGSA